MLWLATAELAAAVSNAGALGVISPYAGMEKHGDPLENMRFQIAAARKLTKKPFGVNIPLDLEQTGLLIDIILKEKVKVVVTAAGDPHHYTEVLRKEGVKVLHVVSTVKQAQSAESCKVDAVIVEGVEAAAHLGFDEILVLVDPQVADGSHTCHCREGLPMPEVSSRLPLELKSSVRTRFVAVERHCPFKI
jgi:enoyl-[acyl-carrier protein] reductase II